MRRPAAIAVSALAAIVFLLALSGGLALGLVRAGAAEARGPLLRASSVVEVVVWVVVLVAPLVVGLGASRSFWPVLLALCALVGAVAYVRYRSVAWAYADLAGFLLGALVFRLVYGILCEGDPRPARPSHR